MVRWLCTTQPCCCLPMCVYFFYPVTTSYLVPIMAQPELTGHGYNFKHDMKANINLYIFCIKYLLFVCSSSSKQNSTSLSTPVTYTLHYSVTILFKPAIPFNVPCCKFVVKTYHFQVSKHIVAVLYNCLDSLD